MEKFERELKIISISIGLDEFNLTLFAFGRKTVLHTDDEVTLRCLASSMYVPKNVAIVDFTSSRFLTTWIVTCLEVSDFIPALVDVVDEVALSDLLMINIKKDLAGRTIDCTTYEVGLIGSLQKSTTMVGVPIEWLQYHGQLMWF